ncbi:glycosyltransferase family 2 protein [Actinotalea sp. Marseille-Q4924]|uniref:glycosyltransferase family 2 protein n=1 Tax=Actinotalea sp. Marseille-Q4924 TaxID=2866571 RepID=UPI001CE404E3|nr:glycosyltransferase [Actinotalea sp. Marseille-Q4924]
MTAGKVLVVLPTLGDRLEELAQTLATVDEQREDVELTLVVVLPATAEAARALASRHGAVLVEDPKQGISEAMNRGIAAATDEEFYAWIGDDDLFRPGALKLLRSMLLGHPDAVLAYGACDYIGPDGRVLGTSAAGRAAQWILPWGPNLIPHPGSMFRLEHLRAVGMIDTSLRYAMDLDLLLALRRRGPFLATRQRVSAFRWHPGSTTVSDRRASGAEARRVKYKYLPAWARPVSALWEVPVQAAATVASRRLSQRVARAS